MSRYLSPLSLRTLATYYLVTEYLLEHIDVRKFI